MAPTPAAMWTESMDGMMGVCFVSADSAMDSADSSSSSSDSENTTNYYQDGASSSHHLGLKKLRALRRHRHRKYFDSAEWSLTQELPAEDELPVAWKVLGTKVPQAPVPATTTTHNLRYSAAPDAVRRLATSTDQAACEATLQPTGQVVWRPASTPTGGQPLAFQHKPSRLSAASA